MLEWVILYIYTVSCIYLLKSVRFFILESHSVDKYRKNKTLSNLGKDFKKFK